MKVRAKELGYYNHKRRKPGEVFELMDEKQFSIRWMEKVDGEAPRPAPAPKKKAPLAQASSEEVI